VSPCPPGKRPLFYALAVAAGVVAARAADTAVVPRLSESIIAVGIAHQARGLTLRPEGSFSVIDQSTGEIRRLEKGREYTVRSEGGTRIVLGSHVFLGPTRLLPGKDGEFVLIGGRKYRGNILFRPDRGGTVTAIDEVGIEEYLHGVLPKEMSPDWPLEALMAQAIVSRTFALNNLGKFSASGYDLSDGTRSQLYTGLDVESDRVRQAVRGTTGLVLTYRGRRFPVFFHSCCGGRTTDPSAVWGAPGGIRESKPPMRGVGSRFCKDSPQYRWTAYFTEFDILSALARHGVLATRLTGVKDGETDRSGRSQQLLLKLDGRWRSISAQDFRLWLGAQEFKSTYLRSIRRRRKGFEFEGLGYGHGAGLCQWCARAMAEQGLDHRRILSSFFPKSELRRMED